MEHRTLGRTGEQVPRRGSHDVVRRRRGRGHVRRPCTGAAATRCINFFDCVDVYEGDRPEEILVGAMAGEWDELVIRRSRPPDGADENQVACCGVHHAGRDGEPPSAGPIGSTSTSIDGFDERRRSTRCCVTSMTWYIRGRR